jgi:hypothetical protein
VPLLNGRLELHQPGCDHRRCAPLECVLDVEAFCGAVLDKFNRGERVAHQSGSHAFQNAADKEDALAFLIAASWQAWLDFNPRDDGRGTNRFGGYLSWILYRRHTDWLRKRYGSTRYGPVPVFTPTADPEVHITETWLDPEYDDSDALDLEAATAGTREALELLQPLLDDEVQTVQQVAERAHVKPSEITRALTQVRAAARRQGLGPNDEERRTLADQAADLHKQRLTYPQIADELGLGSFHTARALLLDYHPELIKRQGRRTLSANGQRTHSESPCDAVSLADSDRKETSGSATR